MSQIPVINFEDAGYPAPVQSQPAIQPTPDVHDELLNTPVNQTIEPLITPCKPRKTPVLIPLERVYDQEEEETNLVIDYREHDQLKELHGEQSPAKGASPARTPLATPNPVDVPVDHPTKETTKEPFTEAAQLYDVLTTYAAMGAVLAKMIQMDIERMKDPMDVLGVVTLYSHLQHYADITAPLDHSMPCKMVYGMKSDELAEWMDALDYTNALTKDPKARWQQTVTPTGRVIDHAALYQQLTISKRLPEDVEKSADMLCLEGVPNMVYQKMDHVRKQFSLNQRVPLRTTPHAVNPFHYDMEEFNTDFLAAAKAQARAAEKEKEQVLKENQRLRSKIDKLDTLCGRAGRRAREARESQEIIQAALDRQYKKLDDQIDEHKAEMSKQKKIVNTLAKEVRDLGNNNQRLKLKLRELRMNTVHHPRRAPSVARRHGSTRRRTERFPMEPPAVPASHGDHHSDKDPRAKRAQELMDLH